MADGEGDEKAFLVFNRIISAIKEKAPIASVKKVRMEVPEGYPAAKLKGYFSQLGISLSLAISPKGEIRVKDVLLR